MKAITYHRFGGPEELRLEELPVPAPGEGELLVRVRAASVNPLDWHMLRGKPRMIRLSTDVRTRPMRPGRDLAGTVEAVGPGVTRFAAGDAVFGATQGAFAEHVCGAATSFASKPATVSFEAAAATPIAGLTALQALRDYGRLQAGGRVLVNGAGGGVGTFAVQVAKMLGAHVTGVCSDDAAPLVRALGADAVIDYAFEDFTRRTISWDLIVDLVGSHPYRHLQRVLAPDGRIAAVGGGAGGAYSLGGWLARTMAAVVASKLTKQKVGLVMSRLDLADLAWLGEHLVSGKVKPVIDRRFALAEVPEAMHYLAAGHVHGKVVIVV